MNNPTLLNGINSKLQLSNVYDVAIGSGLRTFHVNPRIPAEIHTGFADLSTSGAKYISSPEFSPSNDISLGNFKPITTAKKWALFNTAATQITVRITGVDNNNNEITEDRNVPSGIETLTVNSYKMVNEINIVTGTNEFAAFGTVSCYPQNKTPFMTLVQSSTALGIKKNAFFMCSNKNGLKRKARLRSINSINVVGADTEIGLHVFPNNNVNFAGNGISITKLRLYRIGTSQGITFQDDGVVELEPGDLAVFYMESSTTTAISISFTWSYYYTS